MNYCHECHKWAELNHASQCEMCEAEWAIRYQSRVSARPQLP